MAQQPYDPFRPQAHPHEPMPSTRRNVLKWLTHGLGAAFAATLGAPAIAYFLDARHRPARPGAFQTVAKLSDLKPGVPHLVTIRQVRRDAWTLHPSDIVGRAYLIRRDGASVEAFTVTCPHLGCSVNFEEKKSLFVCPCHNGTFKLDGTRVEGAGIANPAPRGMDALEVKLVKDGDDSLVQIEFQSFIQGKPEKVVRG